LLMFFIYCVIDKFLEKRIWKYWRYIY
jgi:hypothetical protein